MSNKAAALPEGAILPRGAALTASEEALILSPFRGAVINDDFVVVVGDVGEAIGNDVAPDLHGADLARVLVVVDGEVVDGRNLSTFYIDEFGRKSGTPGAGRQKLNCQVGDRLLRDDKNKWFVAPS